MKFQGFKDWVFLGLLSCAVYILWDMKTSVDTLNIAVATIIEKSVWHEKQISQHDDRIRSLETKGK